MLQRIHGSKCYTPLSRCHTTSLPAKKSNTRVVAQSHKTGTSPIPKSSLSDIEKFCIETWSDWGVGQFRRVQTTSGRRLHVVDNVPRPDECSEILWTIFQAEKAFKSTNRCQLYNNALVNGAVEGLKMSLPRLPGSFSENTTAHGDLLDLIRIHDEEEDALSLEYVPRTMLSMAFLGCHLAWEEQMDSLCQKMSQAPCSSWQSLRQVDDCLRALRISRHKCHHTLHHLDRQAGLFLQQEEQSSFSAPDQLLRTLMLGGNIAYHIVYQREIPQHTLQGILACLTRLSHEHIGEDDDPARMVKCLAIVGASVAFTDCFLQDNHIDLRLDTTIHRIAREIVRQLVMLHTSTMTLHGLFPFLAWVIVILSPNLNLSEDEHRCIHAMFEQSIRVREAMRSKHTVSAAQTDMYNSIRNMGIAAQVEQHIQGISVDIVLPDHSIAIEVDGPSHFFRNDSMLQIGHGAFKKVLLYRMGWTFVSMPLQTWDDVVDRRGCNAGTLPNWGNEALGSPDGPASLYYVVLEGIGVRGSQSERVLSQVQELGGSSGVELENAEAILLLMVDTMDIKVRNIKDIVIEHPSILLQSPETLKAKYDTLLSAWPSKRQLAGSIASYPMIFDDDFPEKLRKFMDAMMDIGFDKDDVAKMLTKEPGLVVIRKFELLNILKRFRVDVRDPTELKPILKFFGKNPSVLFPMNFKRVYECIEKLENEGGMPFETAVSVVLQNSKVLDRCDQDFNAIRDIISHIQGYGIDHADVMRMLTRYPAIVTMDAERVQSTLSLLSTFNIPSKDIVQYPRVFSHDPFKVIGPRLSYLSEYCVDKIGKLRLSTILTAGDASFIAKYVTSIQGFEKAKEQNTLQSDVSSVHQKKLSHGEKAEQERASMPRSTPPKPPQNQKKPRKKFWRRKLQRLPKQDGDSSSR